MLSEKAIEILSCVLHFGCNIFKFFPYVWDPINFQLLPAPKCHIAIFNIHRISEHTMFAFAVYRLLTANNWDQVPDRQRVLHVVWIASHCLCAVCFRQFEKNRFEIRHFINSLWAYILKHRGQVVKTDFVSGCVVFGGLMIFINGPSHGTGMIEVPCTPNFVSSIFFPCRYPSEDEETILSKVPYFLIETYIVTMVLYVFCFNWVMVFLGLAWVRRELAKLMLDKPLAEKQESGIWEQSEIELTHYRICQRINNILNDSFKFYLEWFSTFLLGLISLLLFATLKVWYIRIHAYLLFPACSLRCFFEVMTPLGMAGKVNEDSQKVLRQWKDRFHFQPSKRPITCGNKKWLTSYHRSCPIIVCTAGSLFTFENSIVLCTLNNCVQLTMNLLLMSNRSAGRSVADTLAELN